MTRGRHRGRNRTRRRAGIVAALSAFLAAAIVTVGGVGNVYAYYSDTVGEAASATAGELDVTATGTVQQENFADYLSEILGPLGGLVLPSQLTGLVPYDVSFTVTNNGTVPWTGDATFFDHFVNQGNEIGETGMVQVFSEYDIVDLATELIAGTADADIIAADQPSGETMPDGAEATGQTHDLGQVSLAPGASTTFHYLALVTPANGTVSSCSAPYVSGGNQVCDLQLLFGLAIDAHGTNVGGTVTTGWADSADGTDSKVVTIKVNTPPVITATTTEDRTPFIGQIGASGQPTKAAYLAGLFTATDAEDGDLTSQVQVTSDFDPNAAGDYTASGSVTDSGDMSADEVTQQIQEWNLVKIDVGQYHTLALDSRGRVWGWGLNDYGEASGASGSNVQIPTLVTGLPAGYHAKDIATGSRSSYVLLDNGDVYAWGRGDWGNLGNGANGNSSIPVKVNLSVKGIQIDAFGGDTTGDNIAVLDTDGAVWTWGYNGSGALGTGNATNQNTPQKIIASGATYVSQGQYSGAAVMNDGSVQVWGRNSWGDLGLGTTDGTYHTPFTLGGVSGATKVSVGQMHMLALLSNGHVWGWGYNGNNRVNSTSTTYVTPVDLAGGWGTAVQINAGWDYSQVVDATGALYAIGYGSYDSLFIGDDVSMSTWTRSTVATDVGMVSGNYDDTLYLNREGSMVYGRGWGGDYALGNNSLSDHYDLNVATAQISLTNVYNDGTVPDTTAATTSLMLSPGEIPDLPATVPSEEPTAPAAPTTPATTDEGSSTDGASGDTTDDDASSASDDGTGTASDDGSDSTSEGGSGSVSDDDTGSTSDGDTGASEDGTDGTSDEGADSTSTASPSAEADGDQESQSAAPLSSAAPRPEGDSTAEQPSVVEPTPAS